MGGPAPTEESATLEIKNAKGLHLRAARDLVETLKPFDAEVTIGKDGQVVDAKSIMGVMMLAAEQGSRIDVRATGPQAREAMDALRALVDARFNED